MYFHIVMNQVTLTFPDEVQEAMASYCTLVHAFLAGQELEVSFPRMEKGKPSPSFQYVAHYKDGVCADVMNRHRFLQTYLAFAHHLFEVANVGAAPSLEHLESLWGLGQEPEPQPQPGDAVPEAQKQPPPVYFISTRRLAAN